MNRKQIFTEITTVQLASGIKNGLTEREKLESNITVPTKITKKLPKEEKVFHPGEEADVVITGNLESDWKESRNKKSNSVVWRYIGTQSGVYRLFPGASLKARVNHKIKPWYRRAVSTAGQFALSYPFNDTYGRGRVISISKAILKKSRNTHSQILDERQASLIGVAGMDMTLNSFRRMVLNVMPGCLNEYDCFLMDQSGYLIFKLDEENDVVHLTEKFSWLGKQFVESLKIFKPYWCNDFLDFKVHLYYKTVVLRKVISNTKMACRQYILLPLQNISVSMLVVPSRRIHHHCQDELPGNPSEGCDCSKICRTCSKEFKQCQCPCACPMSFNRCNNSVIHTFTHITCPAPNNNRSELNAAVLASDFNSVKLPKCEKSCNAASNKEQCNKMSHCIWCDDSIIDSCETFCPFNVSQRISLKFSSELGLLISNLTEQLKTKIEESLQERMYNVLGEKYENIIYGVTYKKNSIVLAIKGSFTSDIYAKVYDVRRAIESRNLYIDIPGSGQTERIYAIGLSLPNFNECAAKLDDCDVNANCSDTNDSYNCTCAAGFRGDGRTCTDINECQNTSCHVNATCTNVPGSYECNCLAGFKGDGAICKDINECDTFECHPNATCTNHVGSFLCTCKKEFVGDGFHCSDYDECQSNPCHPNAVCENVRGSYKCACLPGYLGNGTHCLETYLGESKRKQDLDQLAVVPILSVIISVIVGPSCCMCCIFIVLSKRKRRNEKVIPRQNSVEIRVLGADEAGLNILSERDDQNLTFGITRVSLERTDVDI